MPNIAVVRPPFRKMGQNWVPLLKASNLVNIVGSGGIIIGGSGNPQFHDTGQVASDIVIEWDFDNDGDFGESVEDITSYVLSCETFTGRDWPSLLTGKAAPGKFRAILRNDDDRFSFFNTSSPLNTSPYSLKSGRKLRVRTSTATNPDPTQLARDRFRRRNGELGDEELGIAWTTDDNAFVVSSNKAVAAFENDTQISVVDVDETDYYVQATFSVVGIIGNKVGIAYRYQDINNYSLFYVDAETSSVIVADVVVGTTTIVSAQSIEIYSGITLGVLVSGTDATFYVEGVPLLSGTAVQTDETEVGIYAFWETADSAPECSSFSVWTGLTTESDGIIWTGDVSDLEATVTAGPYKVVQLTGEGWLSKLATQVVSPPASIAGRPTGMLIGDLLSSTNLLNPPGPIDLGDVITGPFAMDESDGLSVARNIEEVELGFLYETNEGAIGFDARSARNIQESETTFSDATGARFGYHEIRPMNWGREIFNRVIAAVSPYGPGVEEVLYTDPGPYALTSGQTQNLVASSDELVAEWSGHTRDVAIVTSPTGINVTTQTATGTTFGLTMPTVVNAGDLLIVAFVGYGTHVWNNNAPAGWTKLVTDGGGYIAKVAAGTEDGTVVNLTATGASIAWSAQKFRITGWYGGTLADGVTVGPYATTTSTHPNPPTVTTEWGAVPTLWIPTYVGYGVNNSQSSVPSGYTTGTYVENVSGTFKSYVGSAQKISSASSTNAGSFTTGVSAPAVARTLAIRGPLSTTSVSGTTPIGSSPKFTVAYDANVGGASQSHSNIQVSGSPFVAGDLVQIQIDDTDSQDDHNVIKTYNNPAQLFANAFDANDYADQVLFRYADDRPIISISFFANKNAAYRAQAFRRRISDKITIEANNNSGLGISQDFFIESISNRWSNGTTLWETTWELSPFVLDTSDRVDATSTIASDVAVGDGTMSVSSTGGLWTTEAVRFPMDITVGDLTITVLDIDGDSSPQTFTVDSSNVVTNIVAGTAVNVANQIIVV